MEITEEEFKVTCSDEELTADFTEKYGGWEPKPETITWLYESIATQKTLPLNWRCEFGRRPPTPVQLREGGNGSTGCLERQQQEDNKADVSSGFDFDDESTGGCITPRRRLAGSSVTPKGSAKKRTTDFAKILASVRRQRNL